MTSSPKAAPEPRAPARIEPRPSMSGQEAAVLPHASLGRMLQVAAPAHERAPARQAPHSSRSLSAGIYGIGACVPDRVLTNADLEKMVETSDEWILTRTGISERRIIAAGEATSDLATAAGRRALEHAGLSPHDLDLIIVATVTPDMPFPAVSNLVQDRLGASLAAAFDLGAACSGFIYGLASDKQFI